MKYFEITLFLVILFQKIIFRKEHYGMSLERGHAGTWILTSPNDIIQREAGGKEGRGWQGTAILSPIALSG